MKKIKLFFLMLLSVGTFNTICAQIDTLGIYNLTDGGGDPVNKSANVKMSNVSFSDYGRVGVTASSGSGFFVSKGFPFGGADYDAGLYHTFTVTPQNGATLYIKKFTMNHKRSGSNPNPGNTVNFKTVVAFGDKEYVIGTGTTLNPTAYFYADNLKIISTGPVTFKLYAKDLFDATQAWMQRWVSLIGAVAPAGTDIYDITGPLDPTYLEVLTDHINALTFFQLDAVGQLVAPLITDMSGLPMNYTFIVNNDVDLTNVSLNYKLPAGTTFDGVMPTNFSTVSKQSVVLKSSWGTRKVYITVKKIKSAPTDVNIKFDAVNNTGTWTEATEGWIASGISGTVTSKAQFATENSALIASSANALKQLSYDISTETSGFTGMFSVETSADGIFWDILQQYNACNTIAATLSTIVTNLPENTKYIRFVYDCKNGSQIVNVNNIQMIRTTSSGLGKTAVEKLNFYPNPAHSQITISAPDLLNEISFFSVSGTLVKRIKNFGNIIDVTDLKDGMYFVKSTTKSGTFLVSPLIIQ